jgi:hypothetical protein
VNARTCLDDRVVRYVSAFLDGGRLKDGTRIYTSVPADPAGVEYMGAEPEAYFALFAGEASHVYTTPPRSPPIFWAMRFTPIRRPNIASFRRRMPLSGAAAWP